MDGFNCFSVRSVLGKKIFFYAATAFLSLFFFGGTLALSTMFPKGFASSLWSVSLLFVPAAAYVAAATGISRKLKISPYVSLSIMLLFNAAFLLFCACDSQNGTARIRFYIVTAATSLIIAVSFLSASFIWKKIEGKTAHYFMVFCVFVSLPFIIGASISAPVIANKIISKKISDARERVAQMKLSDGRVAPFYAAAKNELVENYKFRDFEKILDNVGQCKFYAEEGDFRRLRFYANRYSFDFYFKNSAAPQIISSVCYWDNSGHLSDIGKGLLEYVSFRCSRKLGGSLQMKTDVTVYNKSGNSRMERYNLLGAEALAKLKEAELNLTPKK